MIFMHRVGDTAIDPVKVFLGALEMAASVGPFTRQIFDNILMSMVSSYRS